jgi:hypothetical protein
MLTLTKTNGRSVRDGISLRDGIETIGHERFQVSREGLQSLGREGIQAGRQGIQSLGREGLQVGREGLQAIGSSVADLADTLPLRPKRRRSFPLLGAIVVAIAGAAVIAIIAGLQMRRDGIGPLKLRSKANRQFDQQAASQAAVGGTGTTLGASAADDLVGRSGDGNKQSGLSDLAPTTGV